MESFIGSLILDLPEFSFGLVDIKVFPVKLLYILRLIRSLLKPFLAFMLEDG